MFSYRSRKMDLFMITIIVAIILGGTLPKWVSGQNCNCRAGYCCSSFGFCGTGEAYCGHGCQEGPCYTAVSDIVTEEFFSSNVNPPGTNCVTREFYTRDAFLRAAASFPNFGTMPTGISPLQRQEVAAFFAHWRRETIVNGVGFCNIIEPGGSSLNYCNESRIEFPCAPGKHYHGRGPFKLKWNYNYIGAGNIVGFDGLNDPDILATDNIVSFKASLWFWMSYVHNHMIYGLGFNATIEPFVAMSGRYYPNTGSNRVQYYLDFCRQLDVDPWSLSFKPIAVE